MNFDSFTRVFVAVWVASTVATLAVMGVVVWGIIELVQWVTAL